MTTRILLLLALIVLGLGCLGCGTIAADQALERGNANYKQGRLDQAIAYYTKAIELDSKYAAAYYNRSLVYAKQGKLDQAVADFTKAIELDPKDAAAYYNRGCVYADQGKLDQAIADFTRAAELDPKGAAVYISRGRAYAEQGKLDQAIADLSKAIELDPKSAIAYRYRGLAYVQKGNLDQAIADLSKAIELDPTAPDRTQVEQFIRELSATPTAPVCVLVGDGATNIAKGKSVKGSDAPMTQYPASAAVDGSSRTWWGAGRFAPAWIEIDLGCTTNIVRVTLLTSQTPSGNTVHRVLGRGEYEDWRLLHQFEKWTADSETLGARAQEPWRNIRYLRIETVTSPSWVGWREIEVYPLANQDLPLK